MARIAGSRALCVGDVDADRDRVMGEIGHIRNADMHGFAADALVGQKYRFISGGCLALNRIERHDDTHVGAGRADALALNRQFFTAVDARDLDPPRSFGA